MICRNTGSLHIQQTAFTQRAGSGIWISGKDGLRSICCGRGMQVAAHRSLAVQVDFVNGNGLQDAFAGGVDAVINCAAVSQPALCEKDPALARYALLHCRSLQLSVDKETP